THSNGFAGTKDTESVQKYILLPLWNADPPFSQDPNSSQDNGFSPPRTKTKSEGQEKEDTISSTNNANTVSSTNIANTVSSTNIVNTAGINEVNIVDRISSIEPQDDQDMPILEENNIFDQSYDEDVGAEADMNNLDTTIQVYSIRTTKINKDHPLDQIIGDLQATTITRKMSKNVEEHGFVGTTLK
ncbi:hypothetical protein Tco_1181637, partial [Tanacetum coccineum]